MLEYKYIHFAQIVLISQWVLAAVLLQTPGEISDIIAVLGQPSLSILWTEYCKWIDNGTEYFIPFEWKSSTYIL